MKYLEIPRINVQNGPQMYKCTNLKETLAYMIPHLGIFVQARYPQ